ncbi:hypothetical protein EDC94DRAFT_618058 [Helicostylum pulchrum]|nr:hypothetical protein EDC94DRAFT_618058 [Helicostylum pulchrum]
MSMQAHLSPETLVRIFTLLPPTSQLACTSVCKSWRDMARRVFFSTIIITPETKVSKLIYSLRTTGKLVQSLTVYTNRRLLYQILIDVIMYCPFLLELRLDSFYCKWVWSSYVKLNRLKSISVRHVSANHHKSTHNYLHRIAYKHRSSIETLCIPFVNDLLLQHEFDGIMKYISQFGKLKLLILLNGDHGTPAVYLDTLLSYCKKLEELEIKYFCPLYPPTTLRNEQVTCYPSMRRLEIVLLDFSVGYLEYIMDTFVNLITLHILIKKGTTIVDWECDDIGFFMKYRYIPFTKTLSESSFVVNGVSIL